jgi:peptide subunit release factor 1 (eRF1)
LEDILQEKLAQDKDLVDELTQLLNEMGPTVEIIQRMKEAEEVIGLEAQEMAGGQARVEQEMDKGKKITGAKIDRLG